jgi:hypothetical protein
MVNIFWPTAAVKQHHRCYGKQPGSAYERLTVSGEAMMQMSVIRLLLKRLA